MLEDADLVALVHDRELAPPVAEAPPGRARPARHGGDRRRQRRRRPATAPTTTAALAAASPEPRLRRRAAPTTSTSSTPAAPPATRRASCGATRTSGARSAAASTSSPASRWPTSGRSPARALEATAMVRHACAAPLIHGTAQVAALAGLFGGDTVVLLPQFDPDEIWRAVAAAQGQRAGHHRRRDGPAADRGATRPASYDASSLVAISSSAALFSPAVKDACVEALPERGHHRGDRLHRDRLRRASAFVSAGERAPRRPDASRPGPDVIVLDDDGQPVRSRPGRPAGPGRARPARLLQGPGQDRARCSSRWTASATRCPGDLARVEEDGTVTLLGRGNTCVNTGGEKVFPEEVEGALKSHPDVFDALVIGVPDERLGQRVAALVQPRPGAARRPGRARRSTSAASIAGYKVPRSIWLVDAIRRTVSGKADYALGARVRRRPRARPGHPPVSGPVSDRANPALRPARHRAPDRRLHPVRARRRRGQPGRRPRRARLRPVQRPGRARRGPGLDGRRTPTAARTASTWSCPPGSRPRARPRTSSQLIPHDAQGLRRADAAQARRAAAAGRRAGRRRRARLAALGRAQARRGRAGATRRG